MRTPPTLRLLAVLLAALPLAACRSAYSVRVNNLTDQPVWASILPPGGAALERARLGPGDSRRMDIRRRSVSDLILRADMLGNVGYPGEIRLSPGHTVANVRRRDEGSKGTLYIEEVPRPNP